MVSQRRIFRDHTDYFSDDLKYNKYEKKFYRITDPYLWEPRKRYRNGTSTGGVFNSTDIKGQFKEMARFHAHNLKLNVNEVVDFFKAGINYIKKGWYWLKEKWQTFVAKLALEIRKNSISDQSSLKESL